MAQGLLCCDRHWLPDRTRSGVAPLCAVAAERKFTVKDFAFIEDFFAAPVTDCPVTGAAD